MAIGAPVYKTTITLDIEIKDSQGDTTTLHLDKPLSTVTRAQVEAAFEDVFNNAELYCNKYGNAYLSVESVNKVTINKVTEEIT